MSRSVSVPCNALLVAYVHNDADDSDDFAMARDNWCEGLLDAFPSCYEDDRWVGREDRAVAANGLVCFGVSEYMGIVSLWVAPKDDAPTALVEHWVSKIAPRFMKLSTYMGEPLIKLGTMSNGEGVYRRVSV